MNELETLFSNGYSYINIIKSVFPNKDIRDASKDAITDLNKLSIELKLAKILFIFIIASLFIIIWFLRMNKDLFQVLKATRDSLKGQLDPESQRYLDRMILERELDGKLALFA